MSEKKGFLSSLFRFGESPSESSESPESESGTSVSKQSWLGRLQGGLSSSSESLRTNLTSVLTDKKLDESMLQDLEDILLQSDLGVDTTSSIIDNLSSRRLGKDITHDEVRDIMANEIESTLGDVAQPLELDMSVRPHVLLMVGVNGSGKTTTLGKIAKKLNDGGYKTVLVAADTFRAAAVEQLQIWGSRIGSQVLSFPEGSDASALVYDSYEKCIASDTDVMLIDTAGRLQNKKELMDELAKIIRVLRKHDESAPHTVLLTLDATTGNNSLSQVSAFTQVAEVNGLVMTKLDGTARGGILVSIASQYKLPIYFLGVGESVEDLEPFTASDFSRSLVGLSK